MPAPVGIPVRNHKNFNGNEIRYATLWNLAQSMTAELGAAPPDGAISYRTNAGAKRINFYDSAIVADVVVPRLDYSETVTGTYTFNPGANTPPLIASETLGAVGDTDTMVVNLNSNYLRGYIEDGAAATASTIALRDSNGRIKVADPSANADAVNLGYLTSYVAGVRDPKDAGRVATTANLVATRVSNVLTADANGSINTAGIDGVTTLAVNDRVLVKDQSTGADNGVYIITDLGSAGTPWVMNRASDSDTSAEVTNGLQIWITSGTDHGSTGWLLTTPDPITLNTTALTFVQTNGTADITAVNGIVKSGNTLHAVTSSAYTVGGLIYTSTSSALAQLADVATGNVVLSGGVGVAPAYGKVGLTTHVSGTLPVANGGTGAATLTGILAGNGTGAVTAIAGTDGYFPKWTTTPYLTATSKLYDTGSNVILAGTSAGTSAVNNLVIYAGTAPSTSPADAAATWVADVDGVAGAAGLHDRSEGGVIITRGSYLGVAKATGSATISPVEVRIRSTTNAGDWSTTVNWANLNFYSDDVSGAGAGVRARIGARFTSVGGGSADLIFSTVRASDGALTDYWKVKEVGILQSVGAQTIQTDTGALTLSTGAGNGNIIITPHGSGEVRVGYLTAQSVLFAGANGYVTQENSYFTYNSTAKCLVLGGAVIDTDYTLNISKTGALSGAPANVFGGLVLLNTATSGDAGITKHGIFIESSGTWNGAGSINTALELRASGGSTNYALFVLTGTIHIDPLTASTLLQLDASKNVISSNALPTGVTIGGFTVVRKYAASIGDAAATSFNINHALSTTDVMVQVWDNGSEELTDSYVTRVDANNVQVDFSAVPTTNQYRVVVTG